MRLMNLLIFGALLITSTSSLLFESSIRRVLFSNFSTLSFDIPYTIIRPSALYGERCVSRRVSQIFIENAVQELDITINGYIDAE